MARATGSTAGTARPVLERERLRLGALWRSRMLQPARPDRLIGALAALRRWGLTPAGAFAAGAIHCPQRTAIIDECGALTFDEVQRRTNALARALRAAGVEAGDAVAIMCRNHRGFIEATVACSKLAAHVVYLDTELTAPTIAEILELAGPAALLYDEEFAALLPHASAGCAHLIAWREGGFTPRLSSFEDLLAGGDEGELTPPRAGRCATVLTTATTKPAHGAEPTVAVLRFPSSLAWPAPRLARIPLRQGQTTILAAPLCHPWGFVQLKLGLRLSSTLVLRRHFDPSRAVQDVAEHRATALALVPDMLRDVVALGRGAIAEHETGSLRVIAVNGRALPEQLAMPAMEAFGDVLYNLRGPIMVKLNRDWGTIDRELPCESARRRRASLPLRWRGAHP